MRVRVGGCGLGVGVCRPTARRSVMPGTRLLACDDRSRACVSRCGSPVRVAHEGTPHALSQESGSLGVDPVSRRARLRVRQCVGYRNQSRGCPYAHRLKLSPSRSPTRPPSKRNTHPPGFTLPYPTPPHPTLPYPTLPNPTLLYSSLPYPTLVWFWMMACVDGGRHARPRVSAAMSIASCFEKHFYNQAGERGGVGYEGV